MSKDRRKLTDEEAQLWRRVAATMKPRGEPRSQVSTDRQLSPTAAPRAVGPKQPKRASGASPQNRSAEKRVRRGDLEIDATLDLHGYSYDAARAALVQFLFRAQQRDDRIVVVVTGVGRGGEGVLKRAFPEWICAPDLRPLLSGYAPAHRNHGGAGAFYVFLKRTAG